MRVFLLFSDLYAKCPYYLVLIYVQIRIINYVRFLYKFLQNGLCGRASGVRLGCQDFTAEHRTVKLDT